MSITPEMKMRLIWGAIAGLIGAGGGAAGPWGFDALRNQTSLNVTFSGQARSALTIRDENDQPIVTEQDYSRACMRGIDTEARTRLQEFASRPPVAGN